MSFTDHSVQSVGRLQSVPFSWRTRSSMRSHSVSASRIASGCPIGGISRISIATSLLRSVIWIMLAPSLPVVEVVEEHLDRVVAKSNPSVATRVVGRLLGDEPADDGGQHVGGRRIMNPSVNKYGAAPHQSLVGQLHGFPARLEARNAALEQHLIEGEIIGTVAHEGAHPGFEPLSRIGLDRLLLDVLPEAAVAIGKHGVVDGVLRGEVG